MNQKSYTASQALAVILFAFVHVAHSNVLFQSVHAFGGAGPTGPLIQAADGNLYGTTCGGGPSGNGTVFRATTAGGYTVLYGFMGGNDGANPYTGLVQGKDGNLYGTTLAGGTNDSGTVFQISTKGAFTSLYSFTGGSDGANPYGALVQAADGNFYGTTFTGGASGHGTVFRIMTNGIFDLIYSFSGGSDGGSPSAGLVQASDGDLYGTTQFGGFGVGTVFRISTNGVLTTLYSFAETDGAQPLAPLVQARNGNLYGTTYWGGSGSSGTIFQISTSGVFTVLASFPGAFSGDGVNPYAGLVQGADGNLYGTTENGGYSGVGCVFRISTAGSLTTLYSFSYSGSDGDAAFAGLIAAKDGNFYGATPYGATGNGGALFRLTTSGAFTVLRYFPNGPDGVQPFSALARARDGNLYGTASGGGAYVAGALFRISTSGAYTLLHSFNGTSEGTDPRSALVGASDGNLYGTATGGGTSGNGTVFRLTTNGGFQVLHSFSGGADGYYPRAELVQAGDGNLYGTTEDGGANAAGTVFRLTTNGGLTTIYAFANTDGGFHSGLVQGVDGLMYGTTYNGGSSGDGSVFRISTNGTFQRLHSFTGGYDGQAPYAGLVQGADGWLYGTTYFGGAGTNSVGNGTVFGVFTNGNVRILYSFSGGSDGEYPYAGVVQASDGYLYGTTFGNEALGGHGTVFRVSTNGTFTTLYSFTGFNDGAQPKDLVIAADGNLYGPTVSGGALAYGTLFRIFIAPPLFSQPVVSGDNVLFTFPTVGGQNYRIEQNTYFATPDWVTYTTVTGNGAPYQFMVPTSYYPVRFFRVRKF